MSSSIISTVATAVGWWAPRRLGRLPLAVGLLLAAWLWFVALGPAAAATPMGLSAADAIAIPSSGWFSGLVWPSSSTWYQFGSAGGGQKAMIWVAYLPSDSTGIDLAVYTGTPDALVQEDAASERYVNALYRLFTARNRTDTFVRVMNDDPNRAVSFVGQVTPSQAVLGPALQIGPTNGLAATPDAAIAAGSNGLVLGALEPQQTIWHRFYYSTPGTPASVAIDFLPSRGNGRLDLFTGPDVGHLQQQTTPPLTASDTLVVRQVNLDQSQWVYFTVFDGSPNVSLAYTGLAFPSGTPTTPDQAVSAT